MGLVTERLPMRGKAQSQGQLIEVMEWKFGTTITGLLFSQHIEER